MPVFKSLSLVRAEQILDLADKSFAALVDDRPGGIEHGFEQALEQMFREPLPQRKALLQALDELNQAEALDLIAIMYVGRGDYIDDVEDTAQVREAFMTQLRGFGNRGSKELVSICAEKDMAFHEYLRTGLSRLA